MQKPTVWARGKRVDVMAVVAGLLLVAGCAGPGPAPSSEPVVLRSAEAIAVDIGADPGFAALPGEARMLVRRVLARQSLADLCAGGTAIIKQATRRAVLAAMTAGTLSHPRRAGTAAGRYLNRRCQKSSP